MSQEKEINIPSPEKTLSFKTTRLKLAILFGKPPEDITMEEILADLDPRTGIKAAGANKETGVDPLGLRRIRIPGYRKGRRGRRDRYDEDNQSIPSE